MSLSTISLIVLLASSAVQSARQREICACVPINVCPKANRFSRDDAKYFSTVLKCKEEGFIRCCPHNEIIDAAARRSDIAENIILIDDVHEKFDTSTESTETTVDADLMTTTEPIEDFTTEVALKSERQPKSIDTNVSVIYPKNDIEERQKMVREHLFLIFPNGEIEAAKATETPTSMKPMKRVIVRKWLVTKAPEDSLQAAESKVSSAVIEPQAMDIEEVKQRLSDMQSNKRRKINKSSPITTTTSTTTEKPIEESTKKALKKKKRFRKRLQTTTAVIPSTKALKVLAHAEDAESTTLKTIRKVVYNTRGRTNFLKRPSSQQTVDEDDEREVPEVSTEEPSKTTRKASTTGVSRRRTTTTPKPTEFSFQLEPFFAAATPRPKVLKQAARIDLEHKMMIETVHKALSAIHSGVDMKFVEKMIESHRTRMKEVRKNPTTTESSAPTRPYRGSARFRKPATTPTSSQDLRPTATAGTRTRNLSRTRNTVTTTLTTHKSVRKSPKTLMTQFNPVINAENTLLEEVDMPPKQKGPKDFRASPLYGITMDKDTEMDGDELDKIHETFLPPSTGGFFPVIHNGTPSTLL